MQIVIDIPDEEIGRIKEIEDNGLNSIEFTKINSVMLLPKHGRLIDADTLISDGGGEWNGIEITKNTYSERVIKNAPTILEATKGEEE